MLVNVVRVIILLLLISFSDLPSSVITLPIYTYDVTCFYRLSISIAIFILGEFGFLLTTTALIFLILMFTLNCFPTSFILLDNSESSFSFPPNNAVPSAYLILL